MKMTRKEEGPDQARSWAIAMAGCAIHTILSGINRISGLFYVALIETYGVSRMEANMPFTLRNVIGNLGGPLAGAIGQRYGGRDVTFVGGIFASAGVALCCFAPNVTWISVLWGGIHGMGVALGNTIFPVIVNYYFLKYRATASGLSLSGACVAAFVCPVIIEYMIEHIGLQGTFLITGAFAMHVLPAAMLMTEPSWIKRKSEIKQTSANDEKDNGLKTISQGVQFSGKRGDSQDVSIVSIKRIPSSSDICEKFNERFQPVTKSAYVLSQDGVDNSNFVGSNGNITANNAEQMKVELPENTCTQTIPKEDISISFPEQTIDEVQETSIWKGSVKLMCDPMFHVISISMAAFTVLFDPALTVIVDYIKDKGLLEADAKYFISVMSFGDLIGRLCFGWVTDRNYMSVPKFMLLIHVLQGVCFMILPMLYGFYLLMAIIMIYGMAAGATLVMYPILIANYLASVQSLAIGFISIASGVLSFLIPPLIGYFRDNVGSYNGMFIITGGFSVAAGCLFIFEPLFFRFQKKGID